MFNIADALAQRTKHPADAIVVAYSISAHRSNLYRSDSGHSGFCGLGVCTCVVCMLQIQELRFTRACCV